MDDAEHDNAQDDRKGSIDDQGERLDFRPNGNDFAALNGRIHQDAVPLDAESDEAEGEQHGEVHR